MGSVNKVILVGNLGADPEMRSTSSGNRVATLNLATTRTWNNQNGEKQEKTEWHRVVVWNTKTRPLADVVEKYLKKGDAVYVEGRIEYRQWQDKENQTRYMTEINVQELTLLSNRKGENAAAQPVAAVTTGRTAQTGKPQASPKAATAPGGEFEDFGGGNDDEMLPF